MDHFLSDTKQATDYFPFGMAMPGRSFSNSLLGYRYGFGSKEKLPELNNSGNDYDFGARMYDSRLGRWRSLDPLQKKYPNESHYAFVSDNPIMYADKDGEYKIVTYTIIDKDGKMTQIRSIDKNYFKYEHHNTLSGIGYFTKADVVQNYVVDLRKDGTNQLSYSYEITNRRETSITDYAKGKISAIPSLFNGNKDNSNLEFGYRIIGGSAYGHNSEWTSGLPTAKNSEALNLGDWLGFVGGLRESVGAADLLKSTIGYLNSKGATIGKDAAAIQEAVEIIRNQSENLIEAVSKIVEVKDNNSSKKSFVFKREDDFANEKKGSVQGHAYTGDTTIKYTPAKTKDAPDTFRIKQTKRKN